MFSGIIEIVGKVIDIQKEKSNLHLTIEAPFTSELKIDQSIAHNGTCLTVVSVNGNSYTVTAIDETCKKTNLGLLQIGEIINLERCIRVGDRLDGHIVQGHIDQTGICTNIKDENGSWNFQFEYNPSYNNITVEKGSVCINGVSLTVVNSQDNTFSVCIIPYTFEHTNFKFIKKGSIVNLEFDILGKYISRLLKK